MSYYERPEYKVVFQEKSFEVRRYEAFYAVTYSDESDKNLSGGFQTLFSYISKKNKEEQKISMTVPVIEEKKEGKKKMSFVVPKSFGDNPPEPLDPRLKITKMEGGDYAVISYRGNSDDKLEKEKEYLLMNWIKENHWEAKGTAQVAYFNPPFVPGPLRHNEIMIRINYNDK